jgi:ureidoglycolate lyase
MNRAPAPRLEVEALTRASFSGFGEVIEPASARHVFTINEGSAQRFHDLCRIDTGSNDGRTLVSLFEAEPRPLPFEVRMLERHPLGSQAFIPLDPGLRYLVVVAESPESRPRVFLARHGQGINLARGTWHHPLLALDQRSDFLVIDRGGEGVNCDEAVLPQPWQLSL